jgi:hypothetical protein
MTALPTFTAGELVRAADLQALADAIAGVQTATDQITPEKYGAIGDGIADDTLPIANAIYAATLLNGYVQFDEKLYLTGPITIGATGSYNSCDLRGARMYAQYADTTPAVGKGTILKLKDGGDGHLINIPPADASDVGPGPPRISDMWLHGNSSNQSGSYWLVDLPSHTATANKARSASFQRFRGSNATGGGIRIGNLRNAGFMDTVAILGTTGAAVQMGSCNDWRIINSDFWSTAANCWYSSGGGSVIFTATNFFSTVGNHGVKIDINAGDHTFYGCSFDRNGRGGLYVLGAGRTVAVVGCRFTLNSQDTNNTWSDVTMDGGSRLLLVGCFFDTGAAANRPKYCLQVLNSGTMTAVGSKINKAGQVNTPYVSAFSNDTSAILQMGDDLTALNFFVDYDVAAVNRGRVKGGTAGSPVIFGGNGETNVGVALYAESVGDLTLGRSTNKLAFYGASPARSKQTVTGSKGANAALTSLLTALANLGLITDSST